jgi:hypothetical protein
MVENTVSLSCIFIKRPLEAKYSICSCLRTMPCCCPYAHPCDRLMRYRIGQSGKKTRLRLLELKRDSDKIDIVTSQ